MRRATMVVFGLLAIGIALPAGAEARPRGLPGALFGLITKPFDMILGGVDRMARRGVHRRPNSRPRSAPAAASKQTTPSTKAATAAEPAGTANHSGVAPAAAAALATGGIAAASTASASATRSPETTPPIPLPAPGQQRASLTEPERAGSSESHDGKEASELKAQPTRRASAQPTRSPVSLGVVGPRTWPNAYEDVIGFALWPADYAARLRAHGIGDVLTAILAPPRSTKPGMRLARADAADPTKRDAASGDPSGACGESGGTTPAWPAAAIEHSLDLSPPQRGALDELKAAVGKAVASIKATCRDEAALSPVERLRSLQNTLWAVHDAAILIRAPLTKFYATLTEQQRKQFVVPAGKIDSRAMAMAAQPANRAEFARMCGAPGSNAWPTKYIDQVLRPTDAQRASLETLQKKSFEMAQFLMASCLQPTPTTPAARLDSASDRLTAVIFAASTVSLAFNDFYNQLSDEQKAKLNSFGQQ